MISGNAFPQGVSRPTMPRMSWRTRLKGRAIDTYLRLDRALPGGRGVEAYLDPGDPYSYLLAQHLRGLERRYGVTVRVVPVVAPSPETTAEPALLAGYAIRDAVELARWFEVDFPADAAPPGEDVVRRAAGALAVDDDPAEVLAAVWRGGHLPAPPADLDARLAEGARRLRRGGHYMSGMLRIGRRWFWGIDRLGHAERALGGEPTLLRDRPDDQWPAPEPADSLDLWFSFRSPYSYLALERALELPVDVRVRPVLPMVMRGLEVPLAKRLYIVKDSAREAARLGIPFGRICDPLGAGVERCLAVHRRAEAEGRGADLLVSAARGIWAEAIDVATDEGLRTVAERAGLAWGDVREALADEGWRADAEKEREALYAAGMWGVPSFRLGEHTTWGQDRIELLRRRLRAS